MLPRVCLGRKLSPFLDISRDSTVKKQTLQKIQYEKNVLFRKFNVRKVDFSQNSLYSHKIFLCKHIEKSYSLEKLCIHMEITGMGEL